METLENYETPKTERILQIASGISPLLAKYGAGFFGGVAINCYSNGRRLVHDIDVLCPEKTIKDLSHGISNHLKSKLEISPVGFDIPYFEGHTLLYLEIMSCRQTENGLLLPFGLTTSLSLATEWRVSQGNRFCVVSKELLRFMKSNSSRKNDKEDLRMLVR